MKRDRSTTASTPLAALEVLLREAHAQCTQQNVSAAALLEHTGVARILVPDEATALALRCRAGALVGETFPRLSPAAREQMSGSGSFALASREWSTRTVKDVGMALKGYRMPTPLPLLASQHAHFTHPLTNAVHTRNPLLAKVALEVWEVIGREVDHLLQGGAIVTEDGMKFSHHQLYDPTPLHYDGQPNRVQMIYCSDSGPVRLCAVPGSASEEAKELIGEILGSQSKGLAKGGFSALSRNPALSDLLRRYSVCIPDGYSGILCFRTGVWHFECGTREETKRSSVFRIYCGVVRGTQSNVPKEHLITFAYLREHGWAMEPFAHGNRRHPLFVAEKSSQATDRITCEEQREAFERIKAVPLEQMEHFLLSTLSEQRLKLYGISLPNNNAG